jgi:hypothetical protein
MLPHDTMALPNVIAIIRLKESCRANVFTVFMLLFF